MINNHGHLEIKLFRFNHSVDYLPYYKTFKLAYAKEDSVYDVLNKINKIEKFSYDEKESCNVNINNYFLKATVLISDVVEKVGNELVIKPISLYRVTNDLIINTDDYTSKLELFYPYLNDEQKESFKEKYKLEYYASHTMLINKDYIGDHSLLIADEIISQNPEIEKEILKLIGDDETGILYHTTIKNRMFINEYNVDKVYEKLVNKIDKYKKAKIIKKVKSNIPDDLEIIQYFKGFTISLYNSEGCIYRKLIKQSRAAYVHLDNRRNDLALNSRLLNKNFSLKIAGEILLEAKDKSADFLIVQNDDDLSIFDGKQKQIEKVMNREINLPIITEEQFLLLLKGERNIITLGMNNHKIKVSFLEDKQYR